MKCKVPWVSANVGLTVLENSEDYMCIISVIFAGQFVRLRENKECQQRKRDSQV